MKGGGGGCKVEQGKLKETKQKDRLKEKHDEINGTRVIMQLRSSLFSLKISYGELNVVLPSAV